MAVQPVQTIKIFFCYAHEDDDLRKQLATHLSHLRRLRYITGWFDRDIQAGTDWEHEIETRIDAASIILLLISADFIASDYCYTVEMQRALEKQKAGTAHVIPIILRPAMWEDPPLSDLQALPTGKKPITQWANQDEAWLDVAQGIRELVKTLLSRQRLSPPETMILNPDVLDQLGQSPVITLPPVHLPRETRVLPPTQPSQLGQPLVPVVPPPLVHSPRETRVLLPTSPDQQRQPPTIFIPNASFRATMSPQATKAPQSPTTLLHLLTRRRPKRLHSVTMLVMLIVLLLSSGSIGVYRVAMGHLPWSTSYGPSTPSASGGTPQANGSPSTPSASGGTPQANGSPSTPNTSGKTPPANATSTTPAYNSTLGRTWHSRTSGTSTSLSGVVWSGSQYVAVGEFAIATSPNGTTWTPPNQGVGESFTSVAWSGSQYVAVADDWPIATSPNGTTWTIQNSGTQVLFGVTWSKSQFVAVGLGDILTSPNGLTWTSQNSGTSQQTLRSVVGDGSQFVAVGDNGTILTSPNGATWTPQNSGTSNSLWGVAWSGSQFVAVGTNVILTSPNGATWTPQNSGTSNDLRGVAWVGSQFVAVGDNEKNAEDGGSGIILTSPNGVIWTPQNASPGASQAKLNSVTWSGSQIVVVGDFGTILTSP
jgi:hypothetical protein